MPPGLESDPAVHVSEPAVTSGPAVSSRGADHGSASDAGHKGCAGRIVEQMTDSAARREGFGESEPIVEHVNIVF